MFSDADLPSGPHQAFPIVKIGGELPSKQDLNAALKEIAGGGIVWTDSLRARAFAAPVQTRGKNTGVIENQQVAGLKEIRKVPKWEAGILAAGPLQTQHSRCVAGGERLLGNEFGGKVEMEVRN